TRFSRDSSSDVCSSDLYREPYQYFQLKYCNLVSPAKDWSHLLLPSNSPILAMSHYCHHAILDNPVGITSPRHCVTKENHRTSQEIGRASCRERALDNRC